MTSENDIFISYAHLDDLSPIEGQPGWVSNLHRALEIRVAQLLGEKAKIWRDPKLQGNDYFSDALLDLLPKTEVLLSIFSPRYLKSKWCRRELETFCRTHHDDAARDDNKSRIFKVIKTPVPRDQYPPEVAPLLGYEFYKLDRESGRVRELDRIFGPEAERDFWARLDDLAHDVADCLIRLHQGQDTAGERQRIYLAPATIELKEEYESVRRDLQRRGFDVLPDRNLPYLAIRVRSLFRFFLIDHPQPRDD